MEVVCPKCSFNGKIDDELIPESGRNVTCKRCKSNFFVKKETFEEPEDEGDKGPGPDMGATFQKMATTNRNLPKSQYNRRKIFIFGLLFFTVFGLGYLSGYLTGDWWTKDTTTTGIKNNIEKKGEKPVPSDIEETESKNLLSPIQPEIPETSSPTDIFEKESLESHTTPNPSESTTTFELPESPVSIENWDLYKSDIYIDIDEIDEKIQNLHESSFTKIQKEWELKEYGESLLGINLSGKLSVIDVRGAVYYGEDSIGTGDNFPNRSYRYIIEAENISEGFPKCKVNIGLKDDEDLVFLIKKGSKIYIEGIIYAYDIVVDVYRLNIINPRVDIIF